MTLQLAPLGVHDLARVDHIHVAPDQIKFSGTVHEAFAQAEQGVDFHCILSDGTAVGFFKIDTAYSIKQPFAPDGALGLRALMIDLEQQGRGIATRAIAMLPTYLSRHYCAACVYLTVNMANPAAVRCYRKGGFNDTGDIWHIGIAGPQHIMRLDLWPNPETSQ